MVQRFDDQVRLIIAEIHGVSVEQVLPETPFADIPGNWIDGIELVMMLEGEFGICISGDDVAKIQTVQDLMDYLHERAGN